MQVAAAEKRALAAEALAAEANEARTRAEAKHTAEVKARLAAEGDYLIVRKQIATSERACIDVSAKVAAQLEKERARRRAVESKLNQLHPLKFTASSDATAVCTPRDAAALPPLLSTGSCVAPLLSPPSSKCDPALTPHGATSLLSWSTYGSTGIERGMTPPVQAKPAPRRGGIALTPLPPPGTSQGIECA